MNIEELGQNFIRDSPPFTSEKDYESRLKALSSKFSKSSLFQLKMEVIRLRKLSNNLIDLRRKFGKCTPIPYKDRVHHIPFHAVATFNSLVEKYNGDYTIGVYEAFMKLVHSEQISQATYAEGSSHINNFSAYNVQHLNFGNYRTRGEDRLFLVSELVISTPSFELKGVSSDISVSGLRASVSDGTALFVGQEINIRLTGIRANYISNVLDGYIQYKIVGLENKHYQKTGEDRTWVRAIRHNTTTSEDLFFKKYIQTQKLGSRFDSSDMQPILLNKGYEKLFMQQNPAIPMFFNNKAQLAHVLISNSNKSSLDYWKNQHDRNALPYIFTEKFVNEIIEKGDCETTIYTFCITKNNSKIYFVATEEQLSESGELLIFAKFGIRKYTFKTFTFTLSNIKSNFDELGLDNDNLSRVSKDRIERLSYVANLKDTTSPECIDDFNCTEGEFSSEQINKLMKYRVLNTEKPEIDMVSINFSDKRKEFRYSYEMAINVDNRAGNSTIGRTQDFSESGLFVELDNSIMAVKGDHVSIDLPMKYKGSDSKGVSYEIVGINRTRTALHLQMLGNKTSHRGFFKALSEINKENRIKNQSLSYNRGLLDGLCRVYSRYSGTNLLFLKREKGKTLHSRLVTSGLESNISHILGVCNEQQYEKNIYPLLSSGIEKKYNSPEFKSLSTSDEPIVEDMYIYIERNDNDEINIRSKMACDLKTFKLKKMFLEKARKNGKVYIVQASIFKVGMLNKNFIHQQLTKTRKTSKHKIVQANRELDSTIGGILLTDVTKSTLIRFGIKH